MGLTERQPCSPAVDSNVLAPGHNDKRDYAGLYVAFYLRDADTGAYVATLYACQLACWAGGWLRTGVVGLTTQVHDW